MGYSLSAGKSFQNILRQPGSADLFYSVAGQSPISLAFHNAANRGMVNLLFAPRRDLPKRRL
jgi:hypothetical protein